MDSKINNILRTKEDIFFVDEKNIVELKEIAKKHPLKRSRYCLHESDDSNVHEMIIVAHKSSELKAHRHPNNKPESYHVLEGKLKVKIFNDDGSIKYEKILSADAHPKMYRINGNIWHQPIPMTEWVVYHEVATGPFSKERDVDYAKWKE
jgi:cupin fold WbuC family metalloprotein